ncbi:MAG: cupredoxin domain-containing protein [Vicinamibacteria bacterium]|nr:cupredoxin domain-containing protein [Vicinamibacteria bacterium]
MTSRRLVLGALLLGLAASAFSAARAADAARGLTIAAAGFDPPALAVRRGELLQLDVTSADGAEHCLAIDELRVERRVVAGRATRVDLVPERVGRFPYYCCLHATAAGDKERGTLTVSE